PFLAEFFFVRGTCFRHAVGEEHHTVAGSELLHSHNVRLKLEDAKDSSAFRWAVVRAIAMHDDRHIVPRIRVTQAPPWAVEMRVEERNEAVARDVAAHQRVQSVA